MVPRVMQQRGFSLVELMVAMALGLLISLASVQLFIANQQTFNFQRGTSDVQTGGRFATDMLLRELRTAGLPSWGDATVNGVVLATAEVPGLTSTALLTRDGAVTAGISSSDQLLLHYGTLAATQDCEGNNVAQGTYVLSRYFIRNDADTGTMALVCDAGQRTGSTITGLNATATNAGTVLVSGVDSFQVLLGLDDGDNKVVRANRYVNIATYNDNTAFPLPKPRVVAVRIGLLLRSQERVGEPVSRSTDPASDFRVLDSVIPYNSTTQTAALDDGRVRRLFVATAGLRNLDTTGL